MTITALQEVTQIILEVFNLHYNNISGIKCCQKWMFTIGKFLHLIIFIIFVTKPLSKVKILYLDNILESWNTSS